MKFGLERDSRYRINLLAWQEDGWHFLDWWDDSWMYEGDDKLDREAFTRNIYASFECDITEARKRALVFIRMEQ